MKIYQYWVQQPGTLTINGQVVEAVFYGKSNQSEVDARSDATAQMHAVQKRIDGHHRASEEKYDVPIREEIVHRIDNRNLVTRNRYGALVLNSEDLLFIDIDKPSFGFFQRLFGTPKGTAKEQIVAMVRKKAEKGAYRNMGFRLYETKVGIRMIVQGMKSMPVDKSVMKLMANFNADPLYTHLCEKQQCYRARLTPKPTRIKCITPRVRIPRTDEEQRAIESWIERYSQLSEPFAVCKHICDIGHFRDNTITRYHDDQTRARKNLPLA